ncbi:hypothetical protein ABZ508_02735 [Streptomyces lavendulocolor]|uniref:Uncharacterized protein n=1 Tax=Streptomyces lavendulocolor TaxID=67316 RepID=A0ABV2VYC4_9ACTN
MNPSQIPQLLKQVSYADPRLLPDDEKELQGLTALWATVLRDVPIDYAMHAVGEHYAASPFPIKPSDIADRWRTTVRDRMRQHTGTFEPTEHPDVDPDDVAAYQAALRADTRAVAHGRRQPTPARAIAPAVTEADVAAMRQQKDLAAYIKQIGREAAQRCAARRAAVLRHPDLTERLHDLLGPGDWNGYLAPELDSLGQPNDSHIRRRLAAIVAEAQARAEGSAAA